MTKNENKKPFLTILDPVKETKTPTGEKIIDTIALRIDENGNEDFYVSGKTNIYEKTQAYLEETKIENILKMVTETGNTEYLNRVKGTFVDISEYPANIFEAQQKIKAAEETFMSLPLDIRIKYDNNFNKFLKDFGSDNWIKNMNMEEKAPTGEEKEKKEEKVNE